MAILVGVDGRQHVLDLADAAAPIDPIPRAKRHPDLQIGPCRRDITALSEAVNTEKSDDLKVQCRLGGQTGPVIWSYGPLIGLRAEDAVVFSFGVNPTTVGIGLVF